MKQGNGLPDWIGKPSMIGVFMLAVAVCGWTQAADGPAPPAQGAGLTSAVHDLQQQVDELRVAVAEIRAEAAQYRSETAALRRELEAVRGQAGAGAAQPAGSYAAAGHPETAPPAGIAPPATTRPEPLEQRVASLEEAAQLLNSKINDQYQTKVESASKYRVRLSGLVLMNLFSNRGQTENSDFPSFAIGPNQGNGIFGATLRQSEIGLEVFGPTLAGARTSGNLQADFAGGSVDTWNGVSSGVFRLRIASMRMDWRRTSLLVGQDELFVSPLSPTSFASLAVPSLNYAGNLWSWTPQVKIEHRFDLTESQNLTIQGGIFDNLTGEFPANSYFRYPGPGESSGQPAYGFRSAWTGRLFGRPLTLGAAGYYSRQVWSFSRYSDGWSGMADWEIPIASRWSLTGEFYRGRSLGGIGGSSGRSALFDGNPASPNTRLRGLDSIGGWSQFKFKANSKLEFNAAFGLDNPTGSEVRAAAASQQYVGPLLVRNLSGLVNFIYRPRSNLLFSTEYRHLHSFQLQNVDNTAEQVNMMMGVLF